MKQRKDLFDFMLKQVKYTADAHGDKMPQAFGRWFAEMYFPGVTNIAISDAAGDGKVDLLVTCQRGNAVQYQILNTKFTENYDRPSPVSFYDEITRFWQAFENKANRAMYLQNVVREPLRNYYKKWFRLYDDGDADLYFVTDHRINDRQFASVENLGVSVQHLDDVLQYLAEYIEGAMPETEPLLLSGISNVLNPPTHESEVPTSIVFARLIDFIKYSENDRFDLLFARNVRLWLGNTETNKNIRTTFEKAPKEFAYSNNGITILCRSHSHDPGKQELRLTNPRVVNGSQTLHCIRSVDQPSPVARVMVRIIEVPRMGQRDLSKQVERRKDIIHKISIRSNQQNQIKRWNLVSNDDFQNELARYFWQKRLYYERRQNEWKQRNLELLSIGIQQGPDLRWMTQLIASYHYDVRKLGPANAKGRLNQLFDEDEYAIIRNTQDRLAYQLYLLGCITWDSLKWWSSRRQYIRNMYRQVHLCLFALYCRILQQGGVKLGAEELNASLEHEYNIRDKSWDTVTKALIDYIMEHFTAADRQTLKRDGIRLTPANYVKSGTLMTDLLDTLPKTALKLAKELPIAK
jgi:hypothetical protein